MKSSTLKVFPQDLFTLLIKSSSDLGAAWRDFVDVIKIRLLKSNHLRHSKQGNFSSWNQRDATKQRGRRESKALDTREVVHPLLLALKKTDNSQRMWMASKSWEWLPAQGHQGNEELSSTNARNWIQPIWMILEVSSSQSLPIRGQLAMTLFSSLRNQEQRDQPSAPKLVIFRNVS